MLKEDQATKSASTTPDYPAETGLVIAEPWVSEILAGRKTWEMRTQATRKRGRIALIRKGSGLVVGAATLVDSLPPRTKSQMLASLDRHRVSAAAIERGDVDAWVYPWVLTDVVRIDPPMPYTHPPGAVIWVKLDRSAPDQQHRSKVDERPNDAVRNVKASSLTLDAERLLADRFQRIRLPAHKVAGFRSAGGRELAIERSRQRPRLWAEVAPQALDGMRIVNVRNPGQPYAPGQSRSSNLRSQAPKLSTGHQAVYLEFSDLAAVEQFLDWYQSV